MAVPDDGPPGLDPEGSDSEHSTKTACTKLSRAASVCSIGTICPSAPLDLTIKPSPESPCQVEAPDAEVTDQRGGGSYVFKTGN